jgi:H+/Cl- antiporter ClcA
MHKEWKKAIAIIVISLIGGTIVYRLLPHTRIIRFFYAWFTAIILIITGSFAILLHRFLHLRTKKVSFSQQEVLEEDEE